MLLTYRGRSEKELQERLEKRGFAARHISGTLKRLKETGYLDDQALALDLKHQAFDNKLLGHTSAKKFLLDRGIPNEIVNATLEYDEEAEIQKIQKLMDKKLKSMGDYSTGKKAKRLRDFLVRKGYTFRTIRTAMQNAFQIEEEEE